ncbi:hypothetical protein PENSUB_14122 [Penicillium subrubescens]|uniref:Uncharacterized protein n=2 Tax=Penicillium subrubescens TaxID=1316194 RepID=A0A1Q5UPE5_9EURO|nr:hypothetical protein PENSUB_14122 [Penicillium subrubescens]
MRVYKGKLNTHTSYATKDEVITLITNGGFRTGSTAVVTGQFTVSYTGHPKTNFSMVGTITDVSDDRFQLFLGENQYYWFVGTVTGDKIHMTMKKDGVEDYGDAELTLVHSET